MAEKGISRSRQDYLKTIFILNHTLGWSRAVDVAKKMGHSSASVSIALDKLEKEGFISKGVRGDIFLTTAGEEIAKMVSEKHEFFKELLQKAGVEAEVADREACGIEHEISEESYLKIREYLQTKDIG